MAQRPILNTQLVFLFASKITRSKERGFGLRWFTGTPLRLASASAMLRGIGALHRVSSGFGSKSGLRFGAPDLTGVGDVSASRAFNTAVIQVAFEWINDIRDFQAVDTMGVRAGWLGILRRCGRFLRFTQRKGLTFRDFAESTLEDLAAGQPAHRGSSSRARGWAVSRGWGHL